MRRTLRKLNTWMLTLALAAGLLTMCALPAAQAAEGGGAACGDSLTWSLENGTLTITGTGNMTDFSELDMAPWYEYRQEILRVSFPDGLTCVGDLAFYGCNNLTAVSLPDSVERVGDYAFTHCEDMVLLDLGEGLTRIGEAAFSDCYRLPALQLPDTLQEASLKAFYRCESITAVTIPASVTEIGVSAFSYCKDLVTADIQASMGEIPEFMFYGCEKLTAVALPEQLTDINDHSFRGCNQLGTVYYEGGNKTLDEVKELVNNGVAGFGSTGVVTDGKPNTSVTGAIARKNGDGTITQENTTVTQGNNASVSTTVEHTHPENTTEGGTFETTMNVTVHGKDGWDEAQALVNSALNDVNEHLTKDGEEPKVSMNLYAKDAGSIDRHFVDALAGRDVTLTVTNQNGAKWKLDCSQLGGANSAKEEEKDEGKYDLSCTLYNAPEEVYKELGAETVFLLRFNTSTQVNAEVLVALGSGYARRNATLFKQDGGELVRYQTVVTDGSGVAHFYLASVTNEADYYIAMDLVAEKDDAIIPDELLAEYGESAVRYDPVKYEITGHTSSWGMNIRQVTWIMAGVFAVVIAAVGVTMFLLNKRKLKMGYVPQWEDEDDE